MPTPQGSLSEPQQAGAPSSSVGGASSFAVLFLPQSCFENGLRLANRADDLTWPLSIPIEGGFLFAPQALLANPFCRPVTRTDPYPVPSSRASLVGMNLHERSTRPVMRTNHALPACSSFEVEWATKPGDARRDDRHDALTGQSFHEQVSQIGFHRLQRPPGNPFVAVERRPARQAADSGRS